MTLIKFDAPPTVARFMRSDAFIRLIAGPVGSGKTTGCIFELLRRSIEQKPGPDGIRRTRHAIVRQTLKQLKDTVLKDITTWLDGICSYKVSENVITIQFGDVHSEWLLIPLEDPQDQRRLLSMQLTGAWMQECIEMDTNIIPPLSGRLGRYPSSAQGGPTWFGMIADTNFPTEGSDWHKLMEIETPPDMQIFKQPGGLTPEAENIAHLPGGVEYYYRLARGQSEDWIKRYVHAQYGNDPSGSAVFRTTFKRHWHVAQRLPDDTDLSKPVITPISGLPLLIAQDFGRNPCGLICQMDHLGRLLILEELVSEDMGLELHIRLKLRPAMQNARYLGKQFFVVGDPAGTQRSTLYEETPFDLLKRMGFHGFPAPTNDIDKRLRAVEAFLLGNAGVGVDGAGPRILIDGEKCPMLVRALSGEYRFAMRRNGQLQVVPEKKNPWSDLADALQYACLAAHGGFADYVVNRLTNPPRAPVQRVSPRAWT